MSASPAPTRTILVAEDSATQAEAIRSLLEEHGFRARVARSAEEALASLRGEPVDLVLSDVIMPGMSGYELCRAIKEDPALRALPVVLLTSLSDPMDIIRGLECGADNYITKPYDDAHLIARIRHVFENRELRRRARGRSGIEITFLGERFTVTSEKEQILDLLVSSFEELIRTNDALRASEVERTVLYQREKEARVAAESANRAKSEFLAAMSHDLRTPLNAIGGYAELLELGVKGPMNDEQRAYLQRIKRNQEHLLALVNDVLNFARIERGQVQVAMTTVPVDRLLAGLSAIIEPQVMRKQLEYHYVPSDPSLVVRADREKVEQVLINLLSNAVKFTPAGGTITLSGEARGEMVAITVADTGIGIPGDRLEAIFDPFVQVDAQRTGEQEGVGLGLAIGRNLARLMGGELSAKSQEGAGSAFVLELPRGEGKGESVGVGGSGARVRDEVSRMVARRPESGSA
ncbi:MAG TPA: ATP-binding protein [Gemmatimonadaceae bacterium]